MKIDIRELRGKAELTIKGSEVWLESLYATFPHGSGERPQLFGRVSLEPADDRLVYVSGKVSYSPVVACSRCTRPIVWPVAQPFDVCFRPRPPAETRKLDIKLRPEELDHYYYDNNFIDIEILVNDVVQTAIPMQTLRYKEDQKSCRDCDEDISSDRVFTDKNDPASPSPFTVLGELIKKKH